MAPHLANARGTIMWDFNHQYQSTPSTAQEVEAESTYPILACRLLLMGFFRFTTSIPER